MNKLLPVIISICLIAVFFTGCLFAPVIKPETPKETYLVALTEYNNLLELYVKNKPMIQDEGLKEDAKELFKKAGLALDVWHTALTSNVGIYEGQIRASQVMSELTTLIIQALEATE